MIQEVVNSIAQVILFGIIPFIWWLATARKRENFFRWLGFRKIIGFKRVCIWSVVAAICFMLLGYITLYFISDVETATSAYVGMRWSGISIVIVYALVQTSLSEEILFRGFLLKRLSHKFGFVAGNTVQAVVFGLLHGVMFFGYVGIAKAIIIIVFTGVLGFAMGCINEKLADGSIFPSWGIHFVSNLFSGIISLFSIL